jgi:hypothetical protein
MPRKPARAKHSRPKQTARIVLSGIVDCAANVDAPLAEAVDLLHALLVMGYGMIDNNEDGGGAMLETETEIQKSAAATRFPWFLSSRRTASPSRAVLRPHRGRRRFPHHSSAPPRRGRYHSSA